MVHTEPIFVDNHLLVVNKPAGMLSQADHTGDLDVLTFWKNYLKERYAKSGNVFLGLVHRLDRPASGIMVLARTSKAAARLSAQFREREVEKEYVALVEGRPEFSGTLTDHIKKDNQRVRIVSRDEPGALYAEMHCSIVGFSDGISLLVVRLSTGRPHQIRVQLSSRGTPIMGDFRYGAHRELDGKNLALHAGRLAFEHPVRRMPLAFQTPFPDSWPETFRPLDPFKAYGHSPEND